MLFTEDMKIGIPQIDTQHKDLIDFVAKVNALCQTQPSREEVKESLDFLGSYVVNHFNDEEAFQVESNYPRYHQHREIHMEFIITFKALYEEFQKNGPSDKLTHTLADTVTNWIFNHIKQEDVTFGKYYAKKKLEHLQTLAK